MAINVHTSGRLAGRARVRAGAPAELAAIARWLRAGPPMVIAIRLRANRRADATLATEQAADAARLKPALATWRARIRRRHAVVVLRRYAILGGGLSLALEGLALAGAIPGLVVAAPFVAAAAAAAIALAPGLSLGRVAQLLDEQLGLFDRISTGLELQSDPRAEAGPLARRAISDAAGLTELTLQRWRASTVAARPEWLSLAVVVTTLAALVLLAPLPSAHSTRSKPTASAQAPGGAPGERRASARTPAAGQPKPAAADTRTQHTQQPGTSISAAATHQQQGSTSAGHASTRSAAKPGSSRTGTGTRSASHSSSSADAGSKLGGATRTSSGQTTAQGAPGSLGGSGSRAVAGVSPVAIPRQSTGASPSSATKAPSGSGTDAAKAPIQSSSAGTAHAGAGRSAGTQSAGHALGSTALGNPKTLSGQATHALPLQAGYAPSASSKTSGGHGSSIPGGGGGEGRTPTTGASTGSDSPQSFSYVPFEGGALAEGDAGLLISYIHSLGFVEEQPW
jgi:hypothetical protein